MITERDLDEAIAKCQGESNPTNSTCIKLAAFLTLKDYLYPQESYQQYSYSAPPMEQVETYIETTGDSEFLRAVYGRKADKVWKLMDGKRTVAQIILELGDYFDNEENYDLRIITYITQLQKDKIIYFAVPKSMDQ